MASVVLVADGNRARASLLLEACRGGGLQVRGVGSGPDALEAALAEPPQLVVAALDLPLIDGLRLAEILRANPRTAEARFLFLGRSTERPTSPFDETLPGQAPAAEIAARVTAMLDRQQRMDAVRRESLARRELGGQLAQVSVVDLVQLLHGGRRTGVVELAHAPALREPEAGALWLHEGELVHATVGAQVSGRKALFRLLGWREGRFSFSAERRAPTQSLSGPTRVLLVEGLRQCEELARDASLPPREAEIRLAVPKNEIPHAVHPVTQEVLLLLEMYGRVHEIVEHCGHPDYQVLRTVQTLIERGLVVLSRGESSWPAQRAGWLDPTALRRLEDWLQQGRPAGQGARSAKLLLASADLEATRDFLQLLAPLPGFSVSPSVEGGSFGLDDVALLGELSLGDGPSVEILHVPIGESFAPAWPMLAYGALGVLLVHSHPVADAEAQLRPLAQCLAQLPGARLFRVLLLRKGERVAAEEVQARLTDRSSLFLLPLENGKDRLPLLATMLSRVLP
jgi:CheY-like chemotaxis protein